jgi:hypothetical protein
MKNAATALALLGLAGCIAPTSGTQKLADTAYDMNNASRFGRMDVALEHVAMKSREQFQKEHAGWMRNARIVDIDFNGIQVKKDGDGEVSVTLTWQRADESTTRTTTLVQRWTETRNVWTMASEEAKGDEGLLGEKEKAKDASDATSVATPKLPERPRYQTRVIYETED